jgi:hypothetical protein
MPLAPNAAQMLQVLYMAARLYTAYLRTALFQKLAKRYFALRDP